MVLVGTFGDKAEIAVIAKYAGVGIFAPGPVSDASTIRTAVDEILTNPSYSEKAQAMKKTYEAYEPVQRLGEIIQERVRWFDKLAS